MTVQAVAADITYAFSGAGIYSFPFDLLALKHLSIQFIDTIDGTRHDLIYGTDYTVTIAEAGNYIEIREESAFIGREGSIFIYRNMPVEQPTDWVNNEVFDMELLETAFDRTIMILQQFQTAMTSELAAITWRGNWKTGVEYSARSLVRGPNSNIYLATVEHVAEVFETDLAALKWNLVLDIAEITNLTLRSEAAAGEAETARDLSLQYANMSNEEYLATVNTKNIAEAAMVSAIDSATYAAASAAALPNIESIGGSNVPMVNDSETGWTSLPLTNHGRALINTEDANATKALLALDYIDNTADLDKPVSNATQAALNAIVGLSRSPLPAGTIVPYLGGYFTGTNNEGFTTPFDMSVEAINARMNPLGLYVCDGTALNKPGTVFYDGENRFLPNLMDDRFIMGSSTSGSIGGLNTIEHTHDISHTHGIAHTHTLIHTHTIAHVHATSNHTLSLAQMPSHAHTENDEVWANIAGTSYRTARTSGNYCNSIRHGGRVHISTYASGSSGAHNHGNTGGSSAASSGAASNGTTSAASITTSGNASTGTTANTIFDNRPKFISCIYLVQVG